MTHSPPDTTPPPTQKKTIPSDIYTYIKLSYAIIKSIHLTPRRAIIRPLYRFAERKRIYNLTLSLSMWRIFDRQMMVIFKYRLSIGTHCCHKSGGASN